MEVIVQEEQRETDIKCKLLKKIEEKIDDCVDVDKLEQLVRLFNYLK